MNQEVNLKKKKSELQRNRDSMLPFMQNLNMKIRVYFVHEVHLHEENVWKPIQKYREQQRDQKNKRPSNHKILGKPQTGIQTIP